MGYTIEISVNILKQNDNKDHIEEIITNYMEIYNHISFYENYEFENNFHFTRNHKVMTIQFDHDENIIISQFIKKIKNIYGIHIESVYNDSSKSLLYASQYYLNFMMDKYLAKKYKLNKRTRSYSEGDVIILKELYKNIQF